MAGFGRPPSGARWEQSLPKVPPSLAPGAARLRPLRAGTHTNRLAADGRGRIGERHGRRIGAQGARYRGRVDWLLLVAPLLAIQLALIIVALRDLFRPERRVRGGAKWIWVLVIVFLELLGPLLYFTLGREDE